jgi:glucose-6-phosphate 1-epimerase
MADQERASIVAGINDLPKVILQAEDGARAEVYLHGAHVTSWAPAGGDERLFLSRTSDVKPGGAIRGGVPVVFPQFSDRGPLPKHGFARSMAWEITGQVHDAGTVTARFRLHDNAATFAIWPYRFVAELAVTVGGPALAMSLDVQNTGAEIFDFTAALHTYLCVADVAETAVLGLQDTAFLDTTAGGGEGVQGALELHFDGEVDRIYFAVPHELYLRDPARRLAVHAAGFPDVVTWNPGPAKGATLADLEPEGYRRFVCIEAAAIGQPVRLAPGEGWQGSQTLSAQ